MSWSPEEFAEASLDFPTLRLGEQGLAGRISLRGCMQDGKLIFNPTEEHLQHASSQATYILNGFDVEVGKELSGIPFLKLSGTRLEETAERQGVPLADLHAYPGNKACFSAPQEILDRVAKGLGLGDFIREYVLPYLYGQAFRERFGHWPWPELSHGLLGLLEWLGQCQMPSEADILRTGTLLLVSKPRGAKLTLLTKRARWFHTCPCGSGKRLRNCHPYVKPANDSLRGAMAQGKLRELRREVFFA